MREELSCVLILFHHNAAALALPSRIRTPDQLANEPSPRIPDYEDFPDQLERLAGAFEDLRDRLNDYQEYTVGVVRVLLSITQKVVI